MLNPVLICTMKKSCSSIPLLSNVCVVHGSLRQKTGLTTLVLTRWTTTYLYLSVLIGLKSNTPTCTSVGVFRNKRDILLLGSRICKHYVKNRRISTMTCRIHDPMTLPSHNTNNKIRWDVLVLWKMLSIVSYWNHQPILQREAMISETFPLQQLLQGKYTVTWGSFRWTTIRVAHWQFKSPSMLWLINRVLRGEPPPLPFIMFIYPNS